MLETLKESLIVTVVGMSCVFAVLALLAGVLVVLSKLGVKRGAAELPAAPSTVPAQDADDDDETVAVISAALTVALGEAPTIKRVKLADQDEGSVWAATGRQMVMSSHNLQKK